jgi:flavin-dependent thymidylate synthase
VKVSLKRCTPDAAKLLLCTKQTRLNMAGDDYAKIEAMTPEEADKELKYVFGTIGSSWEFVDYVFLITDVSRAFTHQFVRHRIASFAQQSQRTVDMTNAFAYVSTGKCDNDPEISIVYQAGMEQIRQNYKTLIEKGAKVEDARGILPTNITTNIWAKFNLRALSDLMGDRLCVRAQGEFQQVAKAMREEVLKVHPWAGEVLQVACVRTGYCKFHNFKDCPMKTGGFVKEVDRAALEKAWETISANRS